MCAQLVDLRFLLTTWVRLVYRVKRRSCPMGLVRLPGLLNLDSTVILLFVGSVAHSIGHQASGARVAWSRE